MRAVPPPALLYCTLLVGFLPLILAEFLPTRDEPIPPSALDDDTPLQPDLFLTDLETSIEDSRIDDVTPDEIEDAFVESEDEDQVDVPEVRKLAEVGVSLGDEEAERAKRSSDWDKTAKPATARRVRTGDTILNIRGALRDAIGDASAAPGPLPSSRVDTFVIRPAQPHTPRPLETRPVAATSQTPDKESERDVVVEPHAPVKLPCDLVNVTDVRWYKDSEVVSLSGCMVYKPASVHGIHLMVTGIQASEHYQLNMAVSLPSEGGWLSLPRAEREHAGRWRCVGRGAAGKLPGAPRNLVIYERVSGVWLSVDGRRLDANTWVPLRDAAPLRVTCTAEGGVPPPTLRWRVSGGGDMRVPLAVQPTNYSIPGIALSEASLIATRQLHGAALACRAEQRRPADRADDSAEQAKLDIHVTYPPSFVISRWPGFGVALWAGRGAALRCDVDANPPARAWWHRDHNNDTKSPDGGDGAAGAEWEGAVGAATVRWRELRAAHAGWYRCRATWMAQEYSSIGYYLNVGEAPEDSESGVSEEPPAPPAAAPHSRVDVPLGGSVQLNCPKGSVGCWWRRVLSHNASRWLPAGSARAHGALGISGALYEEGGEYRCIGARSSDARALAELKRVTLSVTGSATAKFVSAVEAEGGWRLECAACGRGVRVYWLRPGGGATVVTAQLSPDIAHCWRAVLQVSDPAERWCVAATAAGGAVAVFPARGQQPPALRALHDAAPETAAGLLLLAVLLAAQLAVR